MDFLKRTSRVEIMKGSCLLSTDWYILLPQAWLIIFCHYKESIKWLYDSKFNYQSNSYVKHTICPEFELHGHTSFLVTHHCLFSILSLFTALPLFMQYIELKRIIFWVKSEKEELSTLDFKKGFYMKVFSIHSIVSADIGWFLKSFHLAFSAPSRLPRIK